RRIGCVEINYSVPLRCRNACGDARDKIAVRIDKGKAISTLQILERHRLQQCRFTSPGLPNYVDVRKAVFVFDAKNAIVVAKINSANLYDATALHWRVLSPQSKNQRETEFCRKITSVISWPGCSMSR